MSIFKYLELPNGSNNINVDASAAVQKASIAPEPGQIFVIHRMIVSIGDTAGMLADEYGNLGSALTNGINLKRYQDGVEKQDYMDGVPIKTNSSWGALCYDVDLKTWGAGPELLVVRWTFSKSGSPITLRGGKLDSLSIEVNDDLSGLTDHRFMMQGTYK